MARADLPRRAQKDINVHQKASIATLLTGFVVLTLAGAAHADLYNVDVSGVPGIETGSYHVVLDATNNNTDWQILSAQANGGVNTPSANVFRVRLYFYSGFDGTGTNLSPIGLTAGNTGGTNLAGTNWGAGGAGGGGGNPHFQHYAQYLNPNFISGANNLLANGSNIFSQNGAFRLTVPSAADIHSVEIQLNDGMSFVDVIDVDAPEASTLALLLPGLIPLGFALRRRRMSRR